MDNNIMAILSPSDAQRLTQRIKLVASTVRDSLFKLRNLVEEAKNSNAWQVLGYQSWTAYLADTLADEPMRLGRDERQELVGYLAGEGLSVRAIATVADIPKSTVARIVAPVPNGTPAAAPVSDTHHEFPTADEWSPDTGFVESQVQYDDGEWSREIEVAEPPLNNITGEVLEQEPPRQVTGLDGKTYKVPAKREPQPMPSRDEADYLNAKTGCIYLGRALETMLGLTYPERRHLFIDEWWPLAQDEVPPSQRELLNPAQLREMAQGLELLANELEKVR
jgi:hypothetical protein